MIFTVDERIANGSIWLKEGELSSIYLKNDSNFPWLIIIPRIEKVQEIYQLSGKEQQQLMQEIASYSKHMNDYFKPDKINVGALGNIVSQLHIHIVARFKKDKAWPHSIWQANFEAKAYTAEQGSAVTRGLQQAFM